MLLGDNLRLYPVPLEADYDQDKIFKNFTLMELNSNREIVELLKDIYPDDKNRVEKALENIVQFGSYTSQETFNISLSDGNSDNNQSF